MVIIKTSIKGKKNLQLQKYITDDLQNNNVNQIELGSFDCIYINSRQSHKKNNNVMEFFKNIGLSGLNIFKKINLDTWITSKNSIECLQCKKTNNECTCIDNPISSYQSNCWACFMQICKIIVQQNQQLCIVCNESAKFTSQSKSVFVSLLKNNVFNENLIDLSKPLLIELGTVNPELITTSENNSQLNFNAQSEIAYLKDISMNPCFIINFQCAKQILDNSLKTLDPDKNKTQYFIAHPITVSISFDTVTPEPTTSAKNINNFEIIDHPQNIPAANVDNLTIPVNDNYHPQQLSPVINQQTKKNNS
jgi:hypothetical protein